MMVDVDQFSCIYICISVQEISVDALYHTFTMDIILVVISLFISSSDVFPVMLSDAIFRTLWRQNIINCYKYINLSIKYMSY